MKNTFVVKIPQNAVSIAGASEVICKCGFDFAMFVLQRSAGMQRMQQKCIIKEKRRRVFN